MDPQPSRRDRSLTTSLAGAAVLVGSCALWVVASEAGAGPRIDPPTVVAAGPCATPGWVAAWTASPQDSSAAAPATIDGVATKTFTDQTLRMVVSPRAGGSELRLHLSNRFGVAPVTFDGVQVAPRTSGASVLAEERQVVTFGGGERVTIQPGSTVVSDATAFDVRPFADVAVSIHVAGTAALDAHHQTNATHYATPPSTGVHLADGDGAAFSQELHSSLALTALDVLAPQPLDAVAVLGDSISDGIGSTLDADRRWPDELARRLLALPAGGQLSVLNAGISGNQVAADNVLAETAVVRGVGPSAVTRLQPDVLDQAGVTQVIVFAGINDIYAPSGDAPAMAIIGAYQAIIERARLAGVRVIGATLTPASLGGTKEAARLAVNEWIRTSGAFDAVADFDLAVRDPADPSRLAPGYGADPVHLNDAGAAALAASFDLDLLQPGACAAR